MKPDELTDEQKARLKSCRDSAELTAMLNSMGADLTDEQLEAVAVGSDCWDKCECHGPHGFFDTNA